VKYKAVVPNPSAKRMIANKVVEICIETAWYGSHKKHWTLTENDQEIIFEIDDDVPWIGNNQCCDGDFFTVSVEYANSTNSRKEKLELIPEPYTDDDVVANVTDILKMN